MEKEFWEKTYREFQDCFDREDKEECVSYILDLLKDNEVDIVELYLEILAPVLTNIRCELKDQRICIWKEHIKTGIIRTIVENCYPYVIKKRDQLDLEEKGRAAVLCPPEEYHDLGARMVADFFTIAGYETIFVGANTPYQDFYNAIDVIKPDVVAISVSNYYHLVATKKMISELKKALDRKVIIVVGGYAFHEDAEKKKESVGADYYSSTFDDIMNL